VVRVGIFRAGALSLSLLLLAVAQAHAQAPPPPHAAPPPAPPPTQAPPAEIGFVSPYEIMKTVRSAGFSPLAPPLREGTDYVLRAVDFRGILTRLVVDARTGAIRDVNRIVPGPGRFSQMESMAPPYDDPDFDAPALGANIGQPLRPPGAHSATWPTLSVPLPRPRPAALAVRKPADDAKGNAESGEMPGAQINSAVIPSVPAATPDAPKNTPAVIPPLND
jgi:hypothetical protein